MEIKEGTKFDSVYVMEQSLMEYCNNNGFILAKAESRLLHTPKYSEDICNRFKYRLVVYSCKYGVAFHKRKMIGNQILSQNMNCHAQLRVNFIEEHGIPYLAITKFNDQHTHDPGNLILSSGSIKNEFIGINDNIVFNTEHNETVIDSSSNFYLPLDCNNSQEQLFLGNVSSTTANSDIYSNQNLNGLNSNTISESDQLLATLEKIKNTAGLTLEIYLESNNLLSVYFQTDEMRFYFDTYPDLFMIDNITYYDDSTISVYTLLVVDGKGVAQIVGIWVILLETYEIMVQMCELFKKYNENWINTQVIVVEKDPPNTKIFQDCFPSAQIEISSAYVNKAFKRDILPNNCGVTADQIKVVIDLLKDLSDSDNTSTFQILLDRLTEFNIMPLNVYLDEYWLPQKSLWSKAWRVNKLSSILSHVTGRKGGYMQTKLRPALINYTTFAKFLEDLVSFSNLLSSKRDYDATMLCIKQSVNLNASNTPEYHYQELLLSYGFEHVQRELKEYPLEGINETIGNFSGQRTTESCDCEFYNAFHLPCRHIFALRKATDLELYDDGLCDERWKLEYFRKQRKVYIMKKQENLKNSGIKPDINGQISQLQFTKEQIEVKNVDNLIKTIRSFQKELEKIYSTLSSPILVSYTNHYKSLINLAKKGEVPPEIESKI